MDATSEDPLPIISEAEPPPEEPLYETDTEDRTEEIQSQFSQKSQQVVKPPPRQNSESNKLEYQQFTSNLRKQLSKRSKILTEALNEIPLFSGVTTPFKKGKVPSDQIPILLKWDKELITPLQQREISIPQAQKKLNELMKELQKEQKSRRNKIIKFIELKEIIENSNTNSVSKKKIPLSKFIQSNNDYRDLINKDLIAFIASHPELTNQGSPPEVKKFFTKIELISKHSSKKSLPKQLADKYQIQQELESFPLEQNPTYVEWQNYISKNIKELEQKLQKELQVKLQKPELSKQEISEAQQLLDEIPTITILTEPIKTQSLELKLKIHQVLNSDEEDENRAEDEPLPTLESLLNEQLHHPFLRDTFQQIVALILAFGSSQETSNKSQKHLVKEKYMDTSHYVERQKNAVKKQISQKTKIDVNSLEIDDSTSDVNLDALSATKDLKHFEVKDISQVEPNAHSFRPKLNVGLKEDRAKEFTGMTWEMIDVAEQLLPSNLSAWPLEKNEDYLRSAIEKTEVKGGHMTITAQRQIVNLESAQDVLRERLIRHPDRLPGSTIAYKRKAVEILNQTINSIPDLGITQARKFIFPTNSKPMQN